ncbi:MAG: UDP-N-acetylmuramoyl-L-alanine--D-glutamate ligase [Desulfobacterales bacterium]|jgi:UDP-N-acetylmuramoylalanine--D-glutamate ligase
MELKNKNIVVVGLGRTGLATAAFLHQQQARVLVSDTASDKELGDNVDTLRKLGVRIETGSHHASSFQNADLIVISPGVSHTSEPIAHAMDKGIPVIGEVELASRFIKEPIIAVTGTNGKTTTTELLGHMLKDSGFKVFVGGNIGNPLIDYVAKKEPSQIVVAEISSFQLDTVAAFRPRVSVLLNITADHLDRYPNFEAYADSKFRIFKNQQVEDVAILNGSDPVIRARTERIRSQLLFFPSAAANQQGAVLNGRRIILNVDKLQKIHLEISNRLGRARRGPQSSIRNQEYLDISQIRLQGQHNFENAAAASLAAFAVGTTLEDIQNTLNHFKGLPHRLEHVATINAVQYFNDSKATNVDGVARALQCFSKPVLLIMGGRDKGSDFKALEGLVRKHAKELIVMGEAAEPIRSALGQLIPTKIAASMEEAVSTAYQHADPDDVVLLSPGCASFDWYGSYTERGNHFRQAVEKVKKRAAAKT